MMTLYEVTMMLVFVAVFCAVHLVFKNIKQIFLWSCKLFTTTILWSLIWVATQIHHLPQWKEELSDSIWTLVNLTKGEL